MLALAARQPRALGASSWHRPRCCALLEPRTASFWGARLRFWQQVTPAGLASGTLALTLGHQSGRRDMGVGPLEMPGLVQPWLPAT